MAIRSTRYCGDGASADDYNAGTGYGAATVVTGCSVASGIVQIPGGHGYTWTAGDALYLLNTTQALVEGIYEITDQQGDSLQINGDPGDSVASDMTIRINGMWTLYAAGGGDGSFQDGPFPGDTVLVNLQASGERQGLFPASGTNDWLINNSGTAFKPITYKGVDDAWDDIGPDQYVKISSDGNPTHNGVYVSGDYNIFKDIWASQGSTSSTYGFRVATGADRNVIRQCKATGAAYLVRSDGYATQLISSVFSGGQYGFWCSSTRPIAVLDCDFFNTTQAGVFVSASGAQIMLLGNRFRDCTKGLELKQSALGSFILVDGNSFYGSGLDAVAIDFTSTTTPTVAIIVNNVFDGFTDYAIDASGSASNGWLITLLNNAYYDCGGRYNAAKFGGILDISAVTLSAAPFASPLGGDFTLVPGSEAIGAGVGGRDMGAVGRQPRPVAASNMAGGMQ